MNTKSTNGWVLALTSVASLMVALDTLVVSTAMTTIRHDLGASIEELEWTVNSYNLSLAVLLLPAAALGDRFGRPRIFAIGLGLFAVTSAACALAPGVGWLMAARAVQGAGAALVISLALAMVSAIQQALDRFEPNPDASRRIRETYSETTVARQWHNLLKRWYG